MKERVVGSGQDGVWLSRIIYVYEVQEDIDPDAGPPTGDEDADEDTLRQGR